MSEQTTPRTVEEAAREEAERRHPEGGQEWVSGIGREEFAAGFVAGASWQAGRMPSVEEVAEVLAAHTLVPWDGRGAWSCGCSDAGRPDEAVVFSDRDQAERHQAERVVALWGAP